MKLRAYLLSLFYCLLLPLAIARRRPSAASSAASNENTDNDDMEDATASSTTTTTKQHRRSPSSYLHEPTPTSRNSFQKSSNRLQSTAILDHHHEFNEDLSSKFSGEVLTYVTPWNRKGYAYAKLMASKITWLVPVWFQIRQDANGTIYIAGEHDINHEWLNEMRAAAAAAASSFELESYSCRSSGSSGDSRGDTGSSDHQECSSSTITTMKIVPRIALEMDATMANKRVAEIVQQLMLPLSKKGGFDGFTLEIPINHFGFIEKLAGAIKKSGLSALLAVPPIEIPSTDGPERQVFQRLGTTVDRVSVMTYDFNNRVGGFPNAPIEWMRAVMKGLSSVDSLRGKLLLGLPMYGWRGTDAMTGDSMVLWLASGRVDIIWEPTYQEHHFIDKRTQKQSSYPTIPFLARRLALAEEMSGSGVAGVALWELGQMMTYFVDGF